MPGKISLSVRKAKVISSMRNNRIIPKFSDLKMWLRKIFGKRENPLAAMRSYQPKSLKTIEKHVEIEEKSDIVQISNCIAKSEENTPSQKTSPFILDLRDASSYQAYCQKVLDISNITEYIRSHPRYHREFINNLEDYQKRMRKALDKLTFSEEEDFTQQLAERVGDIINARLTDTMQGCFVRGHVPEGEKEHAEFLYMLGERIEEYLHDIGVSRIETVSEESIMDEDDYKYWDKTYYKDTDDEEKNLRYEEISVYPHILHYRNEDEEDDVIYIGGSCVVWKYRGRN